MRGAGARVGAVGPWGDRGRVAELRRRVAATNVRCLNGLGVLRLLLVSKLLLFLFDFDASDILDLF